MDNSPLVSLVILNHNGLVYLGALFRECLKSIIDTDYPNLEIVFVDNKSTDNSLVFSKNFFASAKSKGNIKAVRYVENNCNIIGAGYNEGIKISKGDYVALLSNDMVYHTRWLTEIIEAMERDSQIGVAGCKRLVYGSSATIDGLGGNLSIDGHAIIPGHLEADKGQYREIENMDWVGGAAVIRRDLLCRTGLFDIDYIIFYEDTDICFRIRRLGFKVVCVPRAVLWHKSTTTINKALSISLNHYMGERSRVRFATIHFNIRRVLAMLLVDSLAFLFGNPYWKRVMLRAYFWNLKNCGLTLMRRFQYGIPPRYSVKYPVMYYDFSKLTKRLWTRSTSLN